MLIDMRHIAVVTTSRADWGHIEPVLRELRGRDGVQVSLLVGGAHLEARFGVTINAVREAGYTVTAEIPFLSKDDSDQGMAEGIGRATLGFAECLGELRPDILLLTADRFEMLAPASAAMALRIPIAHIEGGEISEGAIDQQVRDALTKMSHLHLVPTRDAADRVIAMGEESWRVAVTGAPSLDHLVNDVLPPPAAVEAAIGMPLTQPPIVVSFHPTTMHRDTTAEAEVFFSTIERCPSPLVFCFPNADAGYDRIIEMAGGICSRRDDAVLRVNLDHLMYWALLRDAACLAGNSSSGIMEAASLALPVVNIGMRQQGRTRAANIIDAPADEAAIETAIDRALDPGWRGGLVGMSNPYGNDRSARAIVDCLVSTELGSALLHKACGSPGPQATGFHADPARVRETQRAP
jgi:UDP-N-acetylglucosamine 2-epimerase (non-hydrolysing)/GDP/UDP-N,N'-diacetylbacillosamine 2-epimerase (hydrolysing)